MQTPKDFSFSTKKSIYTEPDLTTEKPQTLEERTMANIVGGDALLTDGQRRVNSIARLLKMEPVWDVVGDPEVVGKGYYENGVIHLNKQAPALTTVYLHEFCHHLQRSGNWGAFVSFSKSTTAYKQWICEKGGSADFATAEANYKAQIKKTYESKTGSAYNNTRLTNEIMARFISEKMMVEYASGQNTDLATATEHFLTEIAKNRKWYHIVMDWISEMINRLTHRNEQADFLKFQRMLKQAYNDVQSRAVQVEGGREWSAEKGFSEQVDDVLAGTHNPRLDLYVAQTPKYLVDLNFSEGPLLMRNSKVSEILEKHPEISEKTLKSLPAILQNPLLVLKSKTHPAESVVVITEVLTTKGEMVVPIWINQEGTYLDVNFNENSANTNFVASSYGRNIKSLLDYANANDGFLYQSEDIEKVRHLLARNGLQLPTPLRISDSDINIPQKAQDVNTQYMQNSRDYSFSTNGKDGGIISSSGNNENGGLKNAEINPQEWGQSRNPQRGTGILQENLGRNDDQSGGAWLEQRGSQNSRSGESGGNRRLSFEQSQNLKNTSICNLDGTPKKVYHFTENMNFEVFEKGDIGFHFGNEQQAGMRGKLLKKSGRIMSVYLAIKNPLYIPSDIMTWRPRNLALRLLCDDVISAEEYRAIQKMDSEKEYSYNSAAAIELRRILSKKGYDGIVYQNMFEGDGESYIAFYPEQVIIIDDGKSKNTVAPATKEKSIYTEPDLTTEKPQTFEELAAKEVFGDREYSIEVYSEEQYNNFGWVRHNNVLSAAEYSTLLSRYADYKHNKDNYPTTRFGEAVIFSFDYPNILMYVKGTIENPQITKIITIDETNNFIANEIQKEMLKLERERTSSPSSVIEALFGEGIFRINRLRDYASFQEYKRGREGRFGEKDYSFDRNERNGARGTNKSEANNGQNKITVVNPDSQIEGTPMISEPDLTTEKPQTLEERTMANIVGGDALLTDGQRRVNSIARLLKMEPVWDVVGDPEVVGKGYYENGVIHLNKQAPALTTVYLHEFCHHLQRSGNWGAFVSFSKSTTAYKQWICEKGGSADVTTAEANYKAQIKKAYESKTGNAYNDTRLTNEIMARFISEKMMVEYASGQNTDLATATEHFLTEIAKNRKWYHIVMDWISEMINRLTHRNEQADFLKFQRMLKQAYNDVQSRAVQVDTGKEYDINQNFYSEFDSWDGKDTNKVFTIGTTSEALKSVNIKNQEIKMRSGMILQKLSKHPEMSRQIFRDIPELLEHPIIIQFSDAIDPNTGKQKYDSRITVMGELYADMVIDGKTVKKPVLVSLELLPTNQKKTKILDVSFVTSAYTKNTLQQYINENSILYIDPNKKRTQNWLSLNRLQLPLGENQTGPIRKITYIGEKVKIENSTKKTDIQLALEKAGVIDSYGNSIFKNSHNDTSKSKENLENREYSFDINDNLPSRLLAKDLIADTGSSYDSTALAAEVEKIYSALDEGNKNDRVVSMGVPNNRSHVRTSPVNISIREIFEKINQKNFNVGVVTLLKC